MLGYVAGTMNISRDKIAVSFTIGDLERTLTEIARSRGEPLRDITFGRPDSGGWVCSLQVSRRLGSVRGKPADDIPNAALNLLDELRS